MNRRAELERRIDLIEGKISNLKIRIADTEKEELEVKRKYANGNYDSGARECNNQTLWSMRSYLASDIRELRDLEHVLEIKKSDLMLIKE